MASPYKLHFADVPVTAGSIGLTLYGVHLIDTKDPLPEEKLHTMDVKDIPFFDRGNAGFYSPSADNNSYIPFYSSFAMPITVMLINKNERNHTGQVLAMYLETMSITGALFTLSAGIIDRSRPLVYGTRADINKRLDANSQRSFYAGHTAATAAAGFFAAKVFADFNPHSKARPYIWALAGTLPAITAYFRYEAGMHFLSDNVIGYVIGATTGFLVPQLHKTKMMKNVTFVPAVGQQYKGVCLIYRF
jgi:membrane-associated phospholipid phosphatase